MNALLDAELVPLGRIMPASNQSFLCTVGADGPRVIYKPIAGERPLWDFPIGTLAGREYAAYLVSEALGWNIVPPTLLREGPAGRGMVQLWQQVDETQDPIKVSEVDALPRDYLPVLEAVNGNDQPVVVAHEDTAMLRRMAVFDVVVNNADRKGGHVLPTADGHRYGVDHGVCFHTENKLRSVLWGWAGEPLNADELAGVADLRQAVCGELADALADHLCSDEIEALGHRITELSRSKRFPEPTQWPAVPWPVF